MYSTISALKHHWLSVTISIQSWSTPVKFYQTGTQKSSDSFFTKIRNFETWKTLHVPFFMGYFRATLNTFVEWIQLVTKLSSIQK